MGIFGKKKPRAWCAKLQGASSCQVPEGPARHLDVMAIYDSQLPSPKCVPNCLSPLREGFHASLKRAPAARAIARKLQDKNCLTAMFDSRHQDVSSGPPGNTKSNFVIFGPGTLEESEKSPERVSQGILPRDPQSRKSGPRSLKRVSPKP